MFRRGYHLIPLYDEPEQLEAQVRFALSRAIREGGCEPVILVDMGLGEECQEIYERLIWGTSGVYICEPDEIAAMLRKLDNLQIAVNDVE